MVVVSIPQRVQEISFNKHAYLENGNETSHAGGGSTVGRGVAGSVV